LFAAANRDFLAELNLLQQTRQMSFSLVDGDGHWKSMD